MGKSVRNGFGPRSGRRGMKYKDIFYQFPPPRHGMKEIRDRISGRRLRSAIRQLAAGGLIAYPTEAVFGLGCDPDNLAAIKRILELKKRPANKGLILIAANFKQLLPYIELSDIPNLRQVLKTWPGPVTWLIRARPSVSFWLRGEHESIAVRVTAHPVAAQLSREFGKPLVSTSANPSGYSPARSALKTRLYFGHANLFIVKGAVGRDRKTTAIFDARTLARLR